MLACAIASIAGAWRPWIQPVVQAPPVAAAELPVVAPAPLTLPDDPEVLVFGDSWTYGAAATPRTHGYAFELADLIGGTTIVDGVRGSGYLKPGIDGPAFGERIHHLDPNLDPDLIIVQGSINDREQGATGYRPAVNAAWDELAATYPLAQIVVLGPAPHVLPVGAGTARIERDLSALAGARGWWYISPIDEKWITPENYLSVIDVEVGRRHPSNMGHKYLATKVAEALQRFQEAALTTAGDEPSETPTSDSPAAPVG